MDLSGAQRDALAQLFAATVSLDDVTLRAAFETYRAARDRGGHWAAFFDGMCGLFAEAQDEVLRQRQAFEDAAALVSPNTLGREVEAFLQERDTRDEDGDAPTP